MQNGDQGSESPCSSIQNLRLTLFIVCMLAPLQLRRRGYDLRLERFLALTERMVLRNHRVRGLGLAEFADLEGSVAGPTRVNDDQLVVASISLAYLLALGWFRCRPGPLYPGRGRGC